MKLTCLLLLALAGSQSGLAFSQGFFTTGYGSSTCGDFIAAMTLSPPNMMYQTQHGKFYSESTLYVEWARGYLTMHNAITSGSDKFSSGTVATWLENYCKSNATHIFVMGVHELSRQK